MDNLIEEKDMRVIIFYHVAEYCDYSSKLTLKVLNNQIRIETWSSDKNDVEVKTTDYLTPKKAYHQFKIQIGECILGGWQILNLYPKRETWETKRSK